MHIGWIGLGDIGLQMVKRLLAGGHRVTVFNRGQGLPEAMDLGAGVCGDYEELAAASDLLVICLFSDSQVEEVLFEHGTLAAMRPASILAIHTTGSPALAREIGDRAPAGVTVLDATFSGSPQDVADGRIAVMCGGAEQGFDRVKHVFASYARTVRHVGPLGHAQIVKLANNLLFASNLLHAAEAMRMIEDQGLDPRSAAEIIQECSGGSYAMSMFASPNGPRILDLCRPYLDKDVAVARAAAEDAGLDIRSFLPAIEYWCSSQH